MGTIRFLLAIWVCMGHVGFNFSFWTVAAGATPVVAFFVISGFYMALILNGKYHSVKAFYINRMLRLLPSYFIICCLTLLGLIVLPSVPRHLIPWSELKLAFESIGLQGKIYLITANLLTWGMDLGFFQVVDAVSHQMVFTKDIGVGGLGGWSLFLIPQGWTLSLEMYFYLLAPFVVRRLWTLLVVLFISFVSWLIPYGLGLDFFYHMRVFPVALTYFIIGAAIYWLYRKYETVVKRLRKLAFLILPLVVLATINFRSIPLDERLKLVLFVALISVSIPFVFELTKNWQVDRFIGELSYPIYINHLAINLFVININIIANKPLFAFMGSITAAILLYIGVEKRIDMVRQKIAMMYR